jgi:hypothetical protein
VRETEVVRRKALIHHAVVLDRLGVVDPYDGPSGRRGV